MLRAVVEKSSSLPIPSWVAREMTFFCATSRVAYIAIRTRAERSAKRPGDRFMMRVGVTYDLRADYLAMGLGEEETAEFDAPETIDAICQTLGALGFHPVRVGNVHKLAEALVRGERYDAVFNICEGLKGLA